MLLFRWNSSGAKSCFKFENSVKLLIPLFTFINNFSRVFVSFCRFLGLPSICGVLYLLRTPERPILLDIILTKRLSILDVCGSPRYASDQQPSNFGNAIDCCISKKKT